MRNRLFVRTPVLSVQGHLARLSSDFVLPDSVKTLWFECDADHVSDIAHETSDAFFAVALLVAMQKGLDLRMEGTLSSLLYHNVKAQYMDVLSILIPGARKIRIEAPRLTRQNWGGTGVMTGFSGGIDSFCTIIDHSEGRVPPEFQVSHLLFNNVGSHGQTKQDERVFYERYNRLLPHARNLALPFISVNSNLDEIANTNFQLTHTLRNVASALLFQKACGRYLYSSTVHFQEARVMPTYDMGFADTIGLSLLSTETMACQSSGSQRHRFEKTKIVAALPETYVALDVCVTPIVAAKTNCSKCWKCMRTQLTFEIIGALEQYEPVFDLARYRKFRWLFIARIMAGNKPLAVEIQDEIRLHKFKVPVTARIVSKLVPYNVLDFVFQMAECPQRITRKIKKVVGGIKPVTVRSAGWARPVLVAMVATYAWLIGK